MTKKIGRSTSPARRASVIADDVFDQICKRTVAGESIRTICADDSMPSMFTFFDHLRHPENELHAQHYARAKEQQAETYVALMNDVARQDPGLAVTYDESGNASTRVDTGEVQHRRLLIDTLKWTASKLKPKVYGDKQTHEHSGPDGTPIQVITGVPTDGD